MDRYAPRQFMDLMSAERINREVATWLAAWRRYMAAEAGEQLPGGFKAKRAAAAAPEHQLLLLCGAPGKLGQALHLAEVHLLVCISWHHCCRRLH